MRLRRATAAWLVEEGALHARVLGTGDEEHVALNLLDSDLIGDGHAVRRLVARVSGEEQVPRLTCDVDEYCSPATREQNWIILRGSIEAQFGFSIDDGTVSGIAQGDTSSLSSVLDALHHHVTAPPEAQPKAKGGARVAGKAGRQAREAYTHELSPSAVKRSGNTLSADQGDADGEGGPPRRVRTVPASERPVWGEAAQQRSSEGAATSSCNTPRGGGGNANGAGSPPAGTPLSFAERHRQALADIQKRRAKRETSELERRKEGEERLARQRHALKARMEREMEERRKDRAEKEKEKARIEAGSANPTPEPEQQQQQQRSPDAPPAKQNPKKKKRAAPADGGAPQERVRPKKPSNHTNYLMCKDLLDEVLADVTSGRGRRMLDEKQRAKEERRQRMRERKNDHRDLASGAAFPLTRETMEELKKTPKTTLIMALDIVQDLVQSVVSGAAQAHLKRRQEDIRKARELKHMLVDVDKLKKQKAQQQGAADRSRSPPKPPSAAANKPPPPATEATQQDGTPQEDVTQPAADESPADDPPPPAPAAEDAQDTSAFRMHQQRLEDARKEKQRREQEEEQAKDKKRAERQKALKQRLDEDRQKQKEKEEQEAAAAAEKKQEEARKQKEEDERRRREQEAKKKEVEEFRRRKEDERRQKEEEARAGRERDAMKDKLRIREWQQRQAQQAEGGGAAGPREGEVEEYSFARLPTTSIVACEEPTSATREGASDGERFLTATEGRVLDVLRETRNDPLSITDKIQHRTQCHKAFNSVKVKSGVGTGALLATEGVSVCHDLLEYLKGQKQKLLQMEAARRAGGGSQASDAASSRSDVGGARREADMFAPNVGLTLAARQHACDIAHREAARLQATYHQHSRAVGAPDFLQPDLGVHDSTLGPPHHALPERLRAYGRVKQRCFEAVFTLTSSVQGEAAGGGALPADYARIDPHTVVVDMLCCDGANPRLLREAVFAKDIGAVGVGYASKAVAVRRGEGVLKGATLSPEREKALDKEDAGSGCAAYLVETVVLTLCSDFVHRAPSQMLSRFYSVLAQLSPEEYQGDRLPRIPTPVYRAVPKGGAKQKQQVAKPKPDRRSSSNTRDAGQRGKQAKSPTARSPARGSPKQQQQPADSGAGATPDALTPQASGSPDAAVVAEEEEAAAASPAAVAVSPEGEAAPAPAPAPAAEAEAAQQPPPAQPAGPPSPVAASAATAAASPRQQRGRSGSPRRAGAGSPAGGKGAAAAAAVPGSSPRGAASPTSRGSSSSPRAASPAGAPQSPSRGAAPASPVRSSGGGGVPSPTRRGGSPDRGASPASPVVAGGGGARGSSRGSGSPSRGAAPASPVGSSGGGGGESSPTRQGEADAPASPVVAGSGGARGSSRGSGSRSPKRGGSPAGGAAPASPVGSSGGGGGASSPTGRDGSPGRGDAPASPVVAGGGGRGASRGSGGGSGSPKRGNSMRATLSSAGRQRAQVPPGGNSRASSPVSPKRLSPTRSAGGEAGAALQQQQQGGAGQAVDDAVPPEGQEAEAEEGRGGSPVGGAGSADATDAAAEAAWKQAH